MRRPDPPVTEREPRRARPSDALALTAVYLRSFRAALPHVRLAHSDDDIADWMLAVVIGERETGVVEEADEPIAFLILDAPAADGPSALDHLYVSPERRGRGIGDRLVELAKSERPLGLELWTFQANALARRFYARHGFVEVELTDGAGNEEREPDARLVWLPPAM